MGRSDGGDLNDIVNSKVVEARAPSSLRALCGPFARIYPSLVQRGCNEWTTIMNPSLY
jgi:hypothetical protein